jgi:hypothetical protein
MMVLQHILAMPCEMFSVTCIMTEIDRGGPISWPPHLPDLNLLDFYQWEHVKTVVYASPVDKEEAVHHRIVDACQTVENYLGIWHL